LVVVTYSLFFSVMTGSKRASDDGQDEQADNNGHPFKRPKQECDVVSELKILLPSRVNTLLKCMNGCTELVDLFQNHWFFEAPVL